MNATYFSVLKKKIVAYDYAAAAEKIIFTTIGLLLALWINNWSDDKKNKEIEVKTLRELDAALAHDLKDVEETEGGYQWRHLSCEIVLRHLDNVDVYPDSLGLYFNTVFGYSFLLSNTSAYESWKSRGLETITNDSLRLALLDLYDVKYEALIYAESRQNAYNDNTLRHYMVQEFALGRFTHPFDYARVRADRVFRNNVAYLKNNAAIFEDDYHQLAIKIRKIRQMIAIELDQG
jgi:hypothetical protein